MRLEIQKSLVLSTAHISATTVGLFDMKTDDMPLFYEKSVHGWCVLVSSDIPHTCPQELRNLVQFAEEQGCDWLVLDADGDVVDNLPTFEW